MEIGMDVIDEIDDRSAEEESVLARLLALLQTPSPPFPT